MSNPSQPTTAENPGVTKIVETITLKDGRTLGYARYGETSDTNILPTFYFNGTPGCHLEAQLVDQPALKLGLPIISTDRPGFGSSTIHENGSLLSWAQDIVELADHLGIAKFGVLGLSGGGPYALACLHAIPKERLVHVTTVSGLCPISLGTTGMMWQTKALLWVSGTSTWLAEKMIDLTMGKMLRGADKEKLIKLMEAQVKTLPQPDVDKKCFKQIIQDDVLFSAYSDSSKEALRVSSRGAAWEFGLFAAEWGFNVEELDLARLTVWHGALDVNVPIVMPDKLAELLPGLDYRRMESDGHVSLIIRHREQILSDLKSKY